MSGNLVTRIREHAGWSQAQLALAAGTSQPTISAYESGAKQPSLSTLRRVARSAGLDVHLVVVERTVLADAVADVRDSFDERPSEAFRILADLSVRLETARLEDVSHALRIDPGSTGDTRWDALVGGICERLARRRGLPVPPWTRDHHRFSNVLWFVSGFPSLRASALVETPPELSARGVFCHEASLTGV